MPNYSHPISWQMIYFTALSFFPIFYWFKWCISYQTNQTRTIQGWFNHFWIFIILYFSDRHKNLLYNIFFTNWRKKSVTWSLLPIEKQKLFSEKNDADAIDFAYEELCPITL